MRRRIRSFNQDARGVSFIELLVAMIVFALLFLMVDSVFTTAHRASRKAELAADVDQNARFAVERLTREIKESGPSRVTVGGTSPATWARFTSARPSDLSSVFCIDARSNDPLAGTLSSCSGLPGTGLYAPVWQRYIGYCLSGTDLLRLTGPIGSPPNLSTCTGGQVVASHVQSFVVACPGATSPPLCTGATRLEVTLGGLGQETVQGAGLPQQQITLHAAVEFRN